MHMKMREKERYIKAARKAQSSTSKGIRAWRRIFPAGEQKLLNAAKLVASVSPHTNGETSPSHMDVCELAQLVREEKYR